ncbi:deleted in malignant brain tumors 1 protein-like [Mytilus trossulus]|uniref:deleted in malignant brain tumors 1 protein-like n=1 Tax=Mytilus trossulus TaxID=6551 RepID=UPI003007E894
MLDLSGLMIPAHKVDDGIGTIWLNNVNCSGSESELLNCTFNTDASNCRHYGDVGIHCFLNCSTKDEGGLRITEGLAENQGRLEVYYKGEWGTVCDNQFANVDAKVACKQLGYCSGLMIPAHKVEDGLGTIWLNNVNCSGSESELLNCTFNTDASNCRHYGDVGIHCFLNCSQDGEGGLRISEGFAGNQGRLDIYHKGEWGTLCDDKFENVDAEVACRQLGYCSGLKLPSDKVNDGIGTIWLNNVNCSGSESNLLYCTYNYDTSRCRHYHDVGIHCFLNCSTENEGDLRITEGFAGKQGRLEIYYKGEWGTLCDNQFENGDAEVACRQLGYCSGLQLPSNKVNDGMGTIWFNNVNCVGSESNLLNCTYNQDISPCRHYHDVGIHCFLNCSIEAEGDLRIIKGYAENQGRLEIKYKGEWGTVCDNQFENDDAKVACRQLGYCSGLMLPADKVDDGVGTIWFNHLNCSGAEGNLLNCTYNHDISPCRHYHDVGVHCFLNCSTENEGNLRITDGVTENQGRLETYYKGEWGTVCDNQFQNVDAEVACRQLGYCSGQMIPAIRVNDGQGTIWLNDVNCSGSERKLLNCTYTTDTSNCRHSEDVGIHCFLICSTEDEGNIL